MRGWLGTQTRNRSSHERQLPYPGLLDLQSSARSFPTDLFYVHRVSALVRDVCLHQNSRSIIDAFKSGGYNSAMSMQSLAVVNPPRGNPFHLFICTNCGRALGKHFLFRPDRLRDVMSAADTKGRQPNGKLYCRRDQIGYAGAYYQRQLRRTMAPGYERARI